MAWYFYSYHAPLGRGRGLAVLALRFVGLVWLAVAPFGWAEDRRFDADGARADTGVVVGKREVQRGDSTARVLDVAYADRLCRTHRATWEESRWPRGWAWNGVSPGDRLPEVEFLRSEPGHFWLAQRRWEPWEYPLPGLVLLAAAAVLVWSADWSPVEVVAGGSG